MEKSFLAGQRFVIDNNKSRLFGHTVLIVMPCSMYVDILDETADSYDTIETDEFASWVGINC